MDFKERLLGFSIAALCLLIFACGPQPAPTIDKEAAKATIDSVAKAAAAAVMDRDFEKIDQMFADDFTIYRQGKSMSLSAFKDSLRQNVTSYTGEEITDRILVSDDGSCAVYNSKENFELYIDGEKAPITSAYMTMVLERRDDNWKIVHVTRTVEMPSPPKPDMKGEGQDTMKMKKEKTEM